MKAKRQKEIALKKQKEQDQDRNKLILKERLLALDLKAIAAVARVNLLYKFFNLEITRLYYIAIIKVLSSISIIMFLFKHCSIVG